MKQLHLLRHAKSSWDEPWLADHDRPLAPRGRRAGKKLAKHLRHAGIRPDLVLCSSSKRTRETLDLIHPALGDAVVEIEEGLYAADSVQLLSRLREVPESTNSVLVIAHNPGLQDLALTLAAEPTRLPEAFPTAALASFAFDGRWADLDDLGAELVAFVVPRELP